MRPAGLWELWPSVENEGNDDVEGAWGLDPRRGCGCPKESILM